MRGVLSAAKENAGIIAGGVAGFFFSSLLVGAVESGLTPILGAKNAKFARAASGGVVAVGAFYAATRMKNPDLMVAFGAVALGHAIQGALGAFGTSATAS